MKNWNCSRNCELGANGYIATERFGSFGKAVVSVDQQVRRPAIESFAKMSG